jgi:hypothetical protein
MHCTPQQEINADQDTDTAPRVKREYTQMHYARTALNRRSRSKTSGESAIILASDGLAAAIDASVPGVEAMACHW